MGSMVNTNEEYMNKMTNNIGIMIEYEICNVKLMKKDIKYI